MTDPSALADFRPSPDMALGGRSGSRREVISWALWDWGTQPFATVVTTFVFAVYLTGESFGDVNTTNFALSTMGVITGIVVALLAPIVGQNSDRSNHTMRHLRVLTWLMAAITAGMFFVYPKPVFLPLGLTLLGAGTLCSEFASVHYNSKLDDIARPDNVGRVSGFGWGLGYLGGIVILLILNFGIIAPMHSDSGLDIRLSMVACAVWTLVFTLPTFVNLHDPVARPASSRVGIGDAYRQLASTVRGLWHVSRQTVYFLIASALFRDGLAGVFAFGAVIASGTFGFTPSEVLVFGAAANIVAGLSTIGSGLLDDRIGPKKVIMISLVCLVMAGASIFVFHGAGKTVFWVLGMILCLFVGPAQSASRSFLARLVPEGKSGEVFGLYATAGRVTSFLSPALYGVAIFLGSRLTGDENSQYWGILGIVVVLAIGLIAMVPVHGHERHGTAFR